MLRQLPHLLQKWLVFNGRDLTAMIDLTAAADARVPYIVARRLASQGLAVFPVRARRPLTARGVYSATGKTARP
jgi:hypothetical protein